MLRLALLLLPAALYLGTLVFLHRHRIDQPSWRELWTTTFDAHNYTPQGRRLLPVLYLAAASWAIAVGFAIWWT